MAEVPYKARKFQMALPSGSARSHRRPQSGVFTVSAAELSLHAALVGDGAAVLSIPRRPALELVWRIAMAQASLSEDAGRWVRSASYLRLDGSEKGAISYFLGMVQADLAATKLLNAHGLVHVDAVYRLLGLAQPTHKRPDLIGYAHGTVASAASGPLKPNQPRPIVTSTLGRLLVEAKGRSNEYRDEPVAAARRQVKPANSSSNVAPTLPAASLVGPGALRVVSLAHFDDRHPHGSRRKPATRGRAVWRSYLEDPPSDTTSPAMLNDLEFEGVITAARALPIARAVSEVASFAPELVTTGDEFTVARLPFSDLIVGMPTSLYRLVIAAHEAFRDDAARADVCEQIVQTQRDRRAPDIPASANASTWSAEGIWIAETQYPNDA